VRTGSMRHLVAAVGWVVFGLLFFEKALILPPMMFVLTAAFLTERRTLLGGAISTLRRFWKAWVLYSVLLICYFILLIIALHTSAAQPQVPGSPIGVVQFMVDLLKNTLVPGLLGGPWQWYPLQGSAYALAAPSGFMVWVSLIVVLVVLAATILRRRVAWRAWLILLFWVFAADMLPVIIGRINALAPTILGLETRYVADAAAIMALCLGLALWPVTPARAASAKLEPGNSPHSSSVRTALDRRLSSATAALVGLIIIGSIGSVQSYESQTTGAPARTYIANALMALEKAPAGTNVLDQPVPGTMMVGLFGRAAFASTVIGDMARGKLAGKLHWVDLPDGTFKGLNVFGADGQLYPAWVYPDASVPRTTAQGCSPEPHGRIVVKLSETS
jgi:hypothetical protein